MIPHAHTSPASDEPHQTAAAEVAAARAPHTRADPLYEITIRARPNIRSARAVSAAPPDTLPPRPGEAVAAQPRRPLQPYARAVEDLASAESSARALPPHLHLQERPAAPSVRASSAPSAELRNLSAPAAAARARPAAEPPPSAAAQTEVKEDFDINPQLSASDRAAFLIMLRARLAAFATDASATPRPAVGVKHAIHLTDPTPIKQPGYRLSPAKAQTILDTVETLLKRGLINEFNSAWSSPVVLVPKHDGR